MAASVISTVLVQSNANAGSASVAIPTGATFCVISISYFEANSAFTSNTITLDGQSAVLVEFNTQNENHESISMYYISGFATGYGKTFTWDWATGATTADEGATFKLIFCSGINTVDPVRDNKSVYTTSGSRVTVTTPAITSESTDLVLGGASAYTSAIDMAGTRYAGQVELVTPGVYNSAQYDCAHKAGASPSTTMSAYLQQGGLIAVSLKASADGSDAKTASDAGTGTDARTDCPTATLTSPETGSGSEFALLLAALAGVGETGSGSDARTDYPTATLISPESGSGGDVAALPAAVLYGVETGLGSDLAVVGMESTALNASDYGGGLEAVIARWLEAGETGLSAEASAVIAALTSLESGVGLDTAAATILAGDGGAGLELGILVKTALSGDDGNGCDALKSLLIIAGSASDMRLSQRRGQEKIPSSQERTPSKQSRKPSKGVNI
jgi:hypothetical protein